MSRRSHHSRHKNEKAKGSVVAIYVRLLRTFATPYWGWIAVGVLAALLMGGALRIGLGMLDIGVGAVSSKVSTAFQEGGNEKDAVVVPEDAQGEKAPEAVPAEPARKEASSAEKLLEKANHYLEKYGFKRLELDENISLKAILTIVLLVLAFFVLKIIGDFINRYVLRWVAARIVADMRNTLFNKIIHQSMKYFSGTDVGHLISRCTNDTQAVESVIAISIPDLTTAPVYILVAIHFIVSKVRETNMGWRAALALCALPFAILPVILLSRVLKRYQKTALERISKVTSRMQEGFSGVHVIRAFHTEEAEGMRFKAVNEHYFKSLCKAILADEFVHPVMQLSALGLAVAFVIVCQRQGITLGTLVMVGVAVQQAFRPIKDLARINASMQKSAAAAERIFEIIDLNMELKEIENPVAVDAFNSEIRFDHVSFGYQEGQPVLDDVSLVIPKGHMVALVGQTGSGKTTMANLLARFYDPTSGSVTLDGHDLRSISLDSLRQLVGVVSQDTFLFNESIDYNIRYGRPDATQKQITEVADQANASEFINEFPEKYERPVGERGNLLSGGQKQRIAIARAILRNPPILILDEATSALDTVTERLVQEALNRVMKDRTVLVIAHRLSTVKMADCIVVLDHGKIIEMGTHQQLLELNGKYKTLQDMQLVGE